MSPVTVAAPSQQTLAEALAGLAFVQLVNPGAPVVLGSFASSISMQSGAPTFGNARNRHWCCTQWPRWRGAWEYRFAPEAASAHRRFRMLKRPSSRRILWCPPARGRQFRAAHAGWLEGGLAMGYEKFVMTRTRPA